MTGPDDRSNEAVDGSATAGSATDGSAADPLPDDDHLELLSWGLVAALSFLVLALGYRLLTPATPGFPVLLTVAALVGVAGALLAAAARERLNGRV